MSDIKDLIRETNKIARKGRLINNILWGVVSILIAVSLYTASIAIDAKENAIEEKEAKEILLTQKEELLVIADSLKRQAIAYADDLKISEENLQGEKEKLELIKVKYDSIREITLHQTDDLWEYAREENTIQAYADYVKIKGINDEVVSKIKNLLQKTGYMQIEESNGYTLIKPINQEFGLWTTKSTRSIRYGVIGKDALSSRNGDAILQGQPFVILEDSLMSGRTRWAKIAY
tara:strand:+ start:544 stop:1242 length:699 start_codon:yes stop_codon:yes gene_type:complete